VETVKSGISIKSKTDHPELQSRLENRSSVEQRVNGLPRSLSIWSCENENDGTAQYGAHRLNVKHEQVGISVPSMCTQKLGRGLGIFEKVGKQISIIELFQIFEPVNFSIIRNCHQGPVLDIFREPLWPQAINSSGREES
jgi:hypothetical protein